MTFVTFVTNVTKKNSPQKMKILVACEYSGTTRDAFTALGHEAWSCDVLPTETPGNHYRCDVRDVSGQVRNRYWTDCTNSPNFLNGHNKSRSFTSIANAMAMQWG